MSLAIAMNSPQLGGSSEYELVSEGGRAARDAWNRGRNHLRGTATDWEPVVAASLEQIRQTSATEGWNGPSALPVTAKTIDIARVILQALRYMLPQTTSPPDILAESDGEICVDWTADSARSVSISIGDHGKINFAARFGREGEVHAWQSVDTSSPARLEEDLRDLVRLIRKVYAPAVGHSR